MITESTTTTANKKVVEEVVLGTKSEKKTTTNSSKTISKEISKENKITETKAPAKAIDFNELLPPRATDLNHANTTAVSLAGAKRVAFGEVIRSSSNVYFIQLAAIFQNRANVDQFSSCLLYTSPSPRDRQKSRMPSSA